MALNPNTAASLRPLKVMIVDDSAVVRGLISRWLENEPDMVLCGLATDGAKGVEKVNEAQPDVLILDIEMPNMGGLEALPRMIAARPGLKVLMASTLSTRGANVTLRALELGAADYIPKPESTRIGGAEGFRVELLTKIRALCGRTRSWPVPPAAGGSAAPATTPNEPTTALRRAPVQPAPTQTASTQTPSRPATPSVVPMTRTPISHRMDALLVGASTGGPPALRNLLGALGPDWRVPILVVQHMPAAFTSILAEHLDKALPQKVMEAKDGIPIQPGHVYIAPGDFHMTVRGTPVAATIHLDQTAPVNWCRPAVDPLFQSGAQIYGKNTLGLVLTGMGHDGRTGAAALRDAGALVYVQDEASSVVWGMPGAVAEAGLADMIKPIEGLAQAAKAFARGERV